MRKTKNPRHNDLAKIHLARKALGLDEDDYRSILRRLCGVDSAKDLDDLGRKRVLEHFRSLGWIPRPPRRRGRRPNTFEREPYLHKVEALLADMGLSWAYAESIAWRQTGGKGERPNRQPGVKRLEWLKTDAQFRALIAALTREQQKRRQRAQRDAG